MLSRDKSAMVIDHVGEGHHIRLHVLGHHFLKAENC